MREFLTRPRFSGSDLVTRAEVDALLGGGGPSAPVPTDPPSAAFTASLTGLGVLVDVQAAAAPGRVLVSSSLSWGDGSPGATGLFAGDIPFHEYASAGQYVLRLSVADDAGGTSTHETAVTVSAGTPAAAGDYDGAVLADAPSAYYRLQETSGTVATDASANGAHGVLSGAWTYGAEPGPTGGTALDNGAGTGHLITASVSTRTVEMWVRRGPTSVNPPPDTYGPGNPAQYLIDTRPAHAQGYVLGQEVGDNWQTLYVNGVAGAVQVSRIPIGAWAHVVLVATSAATGAGRIFARFDDTERAPVRAQRVAVYPAALSADRVAAHYAAQTGSPGTPGASGSVSSGAVASSPGSVPGAGGGSALGVPAGSVQLFAGAAVPSGWLPCDGRVVGRAAYPRLFAALGGAWGAGDGATSFGLPDLRSRVPVGAAGPPNVVQPAARFGTFTGGWGTDGTSNVSYPGSAYEGGLTVRVTPTGTSGYIYGVGPGWIDGSVESAAWTVSADVRLIEGGDASEETVLFARSASVQGDGLPTAAVPLGGGWVRLSRTFEGPVAPFDLFGVWRPGSAEPFDVARWSVVPGADPGWPEPLVPSLTRRARGGRGGAEASVLTAAMLPPHTHAGGVSADSQADDLVRPPSPGDGWNVAPTGPGPGQSAPVPTMPPWAALSYLIRT